MDIAAAQPNNVSTGELRKDLKLFRGKPDANGFHSWTVFDPVSDKYYKLAESKYRIISCLDHNYQLDEFMEKLYNNGIKVGEKEVVILLNFLRNSGLLLPEHEITEKRIMKTVEMKRKMLFQRILSSYLFFRIPLLRPDNFLNHTIATVKAMFNSWTIMLLVIVASSGYISLIPNWHKFTETLWKSISLEGLLRYSVAVLLIKFVHEFSHAYAAKACGVRVRKMGLAFIVFFPRLYTDLTDSWRINDKKKRILIDAAGILAETVIGGIAALVWTNTGPGAPNTIAYYIFAVSVINTVLVNGNPFIRYDGYYILMDLVGIDNLQKRGVEKFKSMFRRTCFGLEYNVEKYKQAWKNHFLIIYGISSFIYKIFLYTSIILIVYIKFTKVIGIILLILEVYLLVLKPISMEGKTIMAYRKKFKRKNLILAYCMFAVIFLPLVVPLPWIIANPCEIRSAKSTIIFLQNDGFIDKIYVNDGDQTQKGNKLLDFSSPYIDWQIKKADIDKQVLSLELDQLQSSGETIGPVKVKRQQVNSMQNLVTELQRRKMLLDVKSPLSGQFILFNPDVQKGKFLRKGTPVGQVYDPDAQKVIAYVKEENIKQINENDRVYITLENRLEEVPGRVVKINPVPVEIMPSNPILSVFGGTILSRRIERNTFQVMQPYYQVEIIPENNKQLKCGRTGTVWIRKYSIVGVNIFRKINSILQKELTF